jgi:hypothetical protein
MNERIKELADQLGPVASIGNWGRVEWADNVYPQLGDKMYAAIDLEKFAELIIQECVELIDNNVTITAAQTYDDVFVAVYDTNFANAKKIKEHFGVEE